MDSTAQQEVETRYGRLVVPAEPDLISNTLRKFGEWAELELCALRYFISLGDTVLDIGACYGSHSRAFSEAVGENGRVWSFEASRANFDILCQNANLSPIDNINPVFGAVSDISGKWLSVFTSSENRGGSFVTAEGAGVEEKVESITIDSLNIPNVRFMKIDVEGQETSVIAGARETISNSRPIVFCEANDVEKALKLIDSWTFMDYKIFGIRSQAYNSKAFRDSGENPFGNASECGLLFVPGSHDGPPEGAWPGVAVIKIDSADDVVMLLVGQEQYVVEKFGKLDAEHAVGRMIADRKRLHLALEDAYRLMNEAEKNASRLLNEVEQYKKRMVSLQQEIEAVAKLYRKPLLNLMIVRSLRLVAMLPLLSSRRRLRIAASLEKRDIDKKLNIVLDRENNKI